MEATFDKWSPLIVQIVVTIIASLIPAYLAFIVARRKSQIDDRVGVARLMNMYQELASREAQRSLAQGEKITKLEARIERLEAAQSLYVRVVRVLYDGIKLLIRQLESKKLKPAWTINSIKDEDVERVLKELDDLSEEDLDGSGK